MKIQSKKSKGLTLIELMITVAIIAILSSIALPAYDRYSRNTHRTTAKGMLEHIHSQQQSYFANNKTYTDDLTNLGFPASPLYVNKAGEPTAVGSSSYMISVAGCPIASCYTITAVPQNGQAEDSECASFTINSIGQKNASGPKGSKCW